jgi:hypothetical protein
MATYRFFKDGIDYTINNLNIANCQFYNFEFHLFQIQNDKDSSYQ